MVDTKVEELSLNQLKEKAIKLGMSKEDAAVFSTKKQFLAMIDRLDKKRPNEPDLDSPAAPVTPVPDKPNPKDDAMVNKRWLSKAKVMRDILSKQPKIRFFLPLSGKEKVGVVEEYVGKDGYVVQKYIRGAVETVTLNGFKTLIPKGVFVNLPEQVVEELSQSIEKTQNAGEEFSVDRTKTDEVTGERVVVRSKL